MTAWSVLALLDNLASPVQFFYGASAGRLPAGHWQDRAGPDFQKNSQDPAQDSSNGPSLHEQGGDDMNEKLILKRIDPTTPRMPAK